MPFTLAHPAIVIPLKLTGLKLSMTGLIIGSITPDFEFFIQMKEVENIGHKWYGIFLFDLPVALLLAFLFHNVLRCSLLSNLPNIYRKRLIHLKEFNWNRYAKKNIKTVVLSIFIGVLSHLLWDSFTHYDGFFVELIPALSNEIALLKYNLPVYFLLQILFSVLGMIALHFQLLRLPIIAEGPEYKINYSYWMFFALLFLAIISLRTLGWPELNSFGGLAIATMGSIFYSMLATSIIFKIKLQQ